ncbi:hypothetical protein CK203_102873 [Vitis vinifera]|uniref:Uncharacterized protein n=1 Tax=Vitis vinifera TaxID=29760 RepID=A0A438C5W0_VITVI|nr:hypothetical protein CK203_102873 [Vitis vinifera]
MRYPGGMRENFRPGEMSDATCRKGPDPQWWLCKQLRAMSHLNRALAALKQRVRVGERVPSSIPWGRLAKDGSLAPHTRKKNLSEIIRGVTVGIRASTRDGWW